MAEHTRRVLLEVVVERIKNNESDFWEPNDQLVAWAAAEHLLGKEAAGYFFQSVRPVEETKGFTD